MTSAGTVAAMRWQRVAWLVFCGFWAAVWLAGVPRDVRGYEVAHDPGAMLDLLIDLGLAAGSLLLMLAPVGKRGTGRHERT